MKGRRSRKGSAVLVFDLSLDDGPCNAENGKGGDTPARLEDEVGRYRRKTAKACSRFGQERTRRARRARCREAAPSQSAVECVENVRSMTVAASCNGLFIHVPFAGSPGGGTLPFRLQRPGGALPPGAPLNVGRKECQSQPTRRTLPFHSHSIRRFPRRWNPTISDYSGQVGRYRRERR